MAFFLGFGRGSSAVAQPTPAAPAPEPAASVPAQPDPPIPPERRVTIVTVNRYPPGEVFRAGAALVGLAGGLYLLWRIWDVLLLMFLAILLAIAIEPIVNRLRRGPFTRGSGTLVVYTAIVALLGGAIYFFTPTVTSQASAFMDALPDKIQALEVYLVDLPRPLRDPLQVSLANASRGMRAPEPPGQDKIVEAGATAAHSIINFLTVFVLAFYWMVERASIKRAVLRLLGLSRARDVNLIWLEVEEKLGGWVRGQLILMLAVGIAAGVGFWVIGLPSPILLGVAAALFEVIPMVGPFLAFAPAVLVALAIDPGKALVVVGYAVVIQQIEGNVLVPRVMRHAVGLSPLTVLTGILAGATLGGLSGAFLAVPVAGAIQVILSHALGTESSGQAEAHVETTGAATPNPARNDRNTDASLSPGTPTPA